MDKKSFIEQIEDIYSNTLIYFNSNADKYWSKPKSLNGQIGFCILYTAPSYNPDILIIGQKIPPILIKLMKCQMKICI